ncbi:Pimeloyl-ACP methyl ester carboxylesterase [Pseudoxanthobacter soli DSM 19599]|uniref:Pimeloyl-ACP methyl ester carboxylesterase n=1 Tax=Pseudoxanthobacter soli DSM 19599 TaxID=1123029 RepID=A0A1M7Z667_9HYPH|nr:alpha/beta hydrolase [Pseudoxanthobacter soli]SHO60365.1 Pimeloyl-ACP methyl ester carboxylesterase [Pseudoxanthobacter soli DSM 19599]
MPTFQSDGLTIAYSDEGEGEPILLIHGFASSRDVNWRNTGWIDTLVRSGRRVIAVDNRGHGESDKPHDAARYRVALMAEDARRLLDHLGLPRADVMGYSMGARISAFLALAHGERVRSVVFGGLGMGLVDGTGPWEPIVEALEAPSAADIQHKTGLMFRRFAEQTGGDLAALAACMRASREPLTAEQVGHITAPALVAVGTRDVIAGEPEGLAALLPNGRALPIPDRDHMLAVGDKVYKAGVLAFLAERP